MPISTNCGFTFPAQAGATTGGYDAIKYDFGTLLDDILKRRGCMVRTAHSLATSGPSIPDSSVTDHFTDVIFDPTPVVDTDSMFNTVTYDRIVIQRTGFHLVTANVRFPANATGIRRAGIVRGASGWTDPLAEWVDNAPSASHPSFGSLSAAFYFSLGDVVRLTVWQSSGAAMTLEWQNEGFLTNLSVVRLVGEPHV